ncbi:enteropeptidase [Chaetodon auriga]|uniref:enteropeptidase n=1 Tax=Chaetodon auriga TaxID=39042 RepID=UPI004032E1FA
MARILSSLEILLSVVSSLLLVCCIALIVVSWISLKPEGAADPAVLSGQMVITEGAVFSEELKNSSSLEFKSLAFDVQNLVSEAFSHSELQHLFKSCQVLYFSQGSVVVNFDLWFNQLMNVKEAQQQLKAGLQKVVATGLEIDTNSIQITEKQDETTAAPTTITPTTEKPYETTAAPTTITPTTEKPYETTAALTTFTPTTVSTGTCLPYEMLCADKSMCVLTSRFCDGVDDCPDASDEDAALCATVCDGQFVLRGPSGSFSSYDASETNSSSSGSNICRWIIRVDQGLSVKINIQQFETEENSNRLRFYDGVGAEKHLTGDFSGSALPRTVWLLTNQSTVEFILNDVNNLSGFNATYSATNISNLSDEQKLTCTFEQGMCFWRQLQDDDDGNWIRTSGSTFPPLSGPSADHTLGNSSGFYIVTMMSPGQWRRSYRIHSLPLTPPTGPMCLSFWYHMFGEDVHRLNVLLQTATPSPAETLVFRKDGNYGDNWNYGQVALNLTTETTVVFEALKNGGMWNDIALDDITLTSDACGPTPPEPTNVPPPTPVPPIPADCGGPVDLWEPNSTFSSPNYPQSYGSEATCQWTLHTKEGQNIQLHFLNFDIQSYEDFVEVRDGTGPNSILLAVLTGSDGLAQDLFSTTNQMTVFFFMNRANDGRGFRANFTSGVNLGSPAPCAVGEFQCQTGSCIQGNKQCDATVDCPDASDEADCVMLPVNSSSHLQFQIDSSLHSVCADTWTPHLSVFTCQYLGYRYGEATQLPALPQNSSFANIRVTSNRTLETSVSETCSSDKVISLNCDNQPCGVRLVPNDKMETDQSAVRIPGHGLTRVVGGADAAKGAWPWIVSLHWMGTYQCGASLIGRDWLLTAAHCVYGKNNMQYWSAVSGLHSQSDSYSSDVQTSQIDRIIINKHYNRQTKQADIALMHLQQPVNITPSVQPVCLPPEGQDFTPGRKCFIAGWGKDAENGSRPNILQEAEVPLVAQDQCQMRLPEYTITSSMLCAGYPEGGIDTCQGDSGGPLMCLDDGHWTVIGVASFGVGCGRPHRPGAYARVSAFTSWIAQTRRSSSSSFSFS